jgi:hypothetical protein
MNERIKELIPRPWTFPYPDREMYSREQMEHLAELIVQECTEIAKEIAFKHQVKEDTYSDGKKAGAFEVAEGIKQHFGVDGVE